MSCDIFNGLKRASFSGRRYCIYDESGLCGQKEMNVADRTELPQEIVENCQAIRDAQGKPPIIKSAVPVTFRIR